MKVLIAEDDENSRQVLEAILTGDGYKVASFENGAKALQYLQTEFVDLIISDILMPEMDGYGFCRAVKQNYLLQETPFIFYTATYTSPQDEQFALSLGAVKFLVKPMLIPEFLAAIAAVIKTGSRVKNLGFSNELLLNLDEQHTHRVRAKLEKKVRELHVTQQRLTDIEQRLQDFIALSGDWFWETNQDLNFSHSENLPLGLAVAGITELAQTCRNHTPDEMLAALQMRRNFGDFIVAVPMDTDRSLSFKLFGKALFDSDSHFVGYRGVGKVVG